MTNCRKNKSMCEKSILLAGNFIKASSLLLAKITLGSRGGRGKAARHVPGAAAMAAGGSHAAEEQQQLKAVPDPPMRLVEHETSSTSVYVMGPASAASKVDNRRSSIGSGASSVDRRAADYIERFRAKIQADHVQGARSATSDQQIIIPPPPNAKSWSRNNY